LPQGLPKKIQFHLLLTDLAFQIGDPLFCLAQRIRLSRRRCIRRLRLSQLARTPPPAQCRGATGTKVISPLVEILAQDLQLSPQRTHVLTRHHATNR
jgi:hypothetical protein